jgi:hypothetical protein
MDHCNGAILLITNSKPAIIKYLPFTALNRATNREKITLVDRQKFPAKIK